MTDPSRVANLTSDAVCPYCEFGRGDRPTGLVHVLTRPDGMREMGPCPHCEAGARAEARGWPRGFWQGRPVGHIPKRQVVETPVRPPGTRSDPEFVDFQPGQSVYLSPRENAMRSMLLTLRLSGRDVDPSVGIDLGVGSSRRKLVERELAKGKADAFAQP